MNTGLTSIDAHLELTWSKLLGVAVLLAPVPARVKEWAYPVLWGASYYLWRRVQATAATTSSRDDHRLSDMLLGTPLSHTATTRMKA